MRRTKLPAEVTEYKGFYVRQVGDMWYAFTTADETDPEKAFFGMCPAARYVKRRITIFVRGGLYCD